MNVSTVLAAFVVTSTVPPSGENPTWPGAELNSGGVALASPSDRDESASGRSQPPRSR